jgi:hypothetical protein
LRKRQRRGGWDSREIGEKEGEIEEGADGEMKGRTNGK